MKHSLKAVLLDSATLSVEAADYAPLLNLFSQCQSYSYTDASDVISRLQDAQVAICNKVIIDQTVLDACPELKLILVLATGTNNVDLITAKAKGITVCNCQGYSTDPVTQHTMMLILALAGNLISYNQAIEHGLWQKSQSFCLMTYPMYELAGKTLGIIGYGTIGKSVARAAQALGMNVLIGQVPQRPIRHDSIELSELLPQVDVLSLHCPLTEDTRNLITEKELRLMKSNAFLINTARGGIVNEHDLANVLRSGHLAGAALDSLTVEPPKQGNPLLEPDVPRLLITPHCAWATTEAQLRIIKQTIENTQAFLSGSPIRVVN